MIFCEYASPMPGSALSWSLLAVLMSSLSAAAIEDCAAFISGTGSLACAKENRGWTIARLAATTAETIRTRNFCTMSSSCVNSTLPNGVGHAINRQHVGGNAVVDAGRLGVAHHVFE